MPAEWMGTNYALFEFDDIVGSWTLNALKTVLSRAHDGTYDVITIKTLFEWPSKT